MRAYHLIFRFLTMVRTEEVIVRANDISDLFDISSLAMRYEMFNSLRGISFRRPAFFSRVLL